VPQWEPSCCRARQRERRRSDGSRSFIGHWVGRLLFYEAPLAVFAAVYTAFGLLVLAVWWWVPLQRQPEPDAMRAR
jgi:hypothetical protein